MGGTNSVLIKINRNEVKTNEVKINQQEIKSSRSYLIKSNTTFITGSFTCNKNIIDTINKSSKAELNKVIKLTKAKSIDTVYSQRKLNKNKRIMNEAIKQQEKKLEEFKLLPRKHKIKEKEDGAAEIPLLSPKAISMKSDKLGVFLID